MAILIVLAIWFAILFAVGRAAENRSRRSWPWVLLAAFIGIFAFIPLVIAGTSKAGRQEELEETRRLSEPAAVTQLKELGELRDRGVLTAEEFDEKKARLLDRI